MKRLSTAGADAEEVMVLRTRPITHSHINRAGLPAGSLVPNFSGSTLEDTVLTSAAFTGSAFLLVFSDPQCGPCNLLLPRLTTLAKRAPAVKVLLVSRGDLSLNRMKFRDLPASFCVVLQTRSEISAAFQLFLTPSAFLINDNGVVASEAAVGVDSVLNLFRAAGIKTLLLEA